MKSTRPAERSFPRVVGGIVAWLALTIYFLLPPREAMSWGLDSSNYGSYAWMAATGRQFGGDTVAMTGPLGFLAYGHTYSGFLFWPYFAGDLLFKTAFAFLVVRIFSRFPSGIWRWAWLATLVVFLPSVDDLLYDFAVLLAAIALLVRRDGKTFDLTAAIAAMLLGFSVLMKGSHATLAGFSIGVVILHAVLQKNGQRAALAGSLALLTFLAGWFACGQQLRNLPGYFAGIWALSSGYNETMALAAEPRMLTAGLALAALLTLALLASGLAARERASRTLLAGFYTVFAFLQWKHGFVRADGHVYMFFGFVAVAAPLFQMTFWTVDASTSDERKMFAGAAMAGLAFLAAAVASSSFSAIRFGELALSVPQRFAASARYLTAPAKTRAPLDAALQKQKQLAELADIRRDVGAGSIDFFGYEQGTLLLNGLNYRPRPMGGGSFNVYHPHLQRRNGSYLSVPANRPDFFLLKLQTIDGRLPAADDPLTLLSLLKNYQPIRARRDYVLLEKISGASATDAPAAPLAEARFSLDEWIDVPARPDALTLFSIKLGTSARGAMQAIAYHPAPLSIEVETSDGQPAQTFRISPLSLHEPVLLSPLVVDTADVVSLYAEPSGGKKVKRIRVRAPKGGFARNGSVAFFSQPRPPAASDAAVEIVSYLKHPLSNRPPLAIATQETGITELYDEPVTLVHAPGSITFPVRQNDRQINFSFGMMPQSYDPGETDGAEFIVEFLSENRPPQLLFSRLLQPRTRTSDRGWHTARVFFPPNVAPGVVCIRTERGPAGNGAWDQSFVSHIQILEGGATPDPRQLSGFTVAPEAPGFPDTQPSLLDGREVRSLPPPGEIKFAIPAASRAVTLALGVLPAAYEGENHSDGVGYTVVAIAADGREQTLRSGIIDPVHDWRARDTVTFEVPLPELPAGSRLALRINGGAKQDERWDWSYVQTVRFR